MHMPICPNGHNSTDADYCDECGAAIGGAAASAGATAVATEASAAPAPQTCPQCGATRTGRFCEVDGYDFVAADLRGDQPAAATGDSGSGQAGGGGAGSGEAGGGAGSGGTDAGDTAGGGAAAGPNAGNGGAHPTGAGAGANDTGPAGGQDAGTGGAGTAAGDVAEGKGAAGDGEGGAGHPSTAGDAPAGTRWRLAVRADHDYHLRVLAMNGPDADHMEFPKFAPERQFALQHDQVLVGRASRSRGIEPQIDLTGPPEDPGVSRSHAMLVRGADGWSVVDLDSANGTYLNDSDQPIAANHPVPLHDGDRIHVGAWTTLRLLTA
ncbi:hypothetical protein Athai_19550 [Actinocatenispora thailandica]|uniref:FHA domain-containing protein n=1 Tax=Actinocatenispora thailandica TaxID=227318 RepID=A0A7R7DMR6_9ACTN|nr:FHA domain-containing protein [Actinocatenispora thailandica]BCJ34452.1 hypothetical protein Athai_19550 [Actinocatenispora thailandica]